MTISHKDPVLEEHVFQVVRSAISKRDTMPRELDRETHWKEQIRWGGWFAVLIKMFN